MARTRNLKPSFFANDELAEIAPLGRLLFQGLWTIADREGRLEDRPRRIKAELLPYDDCDADTYLNDLHQRGFIQRYTANGRHYIQVVNFSKHQSPHPNEVASEIPAPDNSVSTKLVLTDDSVTNQASNPLISTNTSNLEPKTAPARASSPPKQPKAQPPPERDGPTDAIPPFELVLALCEATGADVSELSAGVKGKQAAVAKRLRDDGVTPEDVRRCVTWLRSQSWRTNGIDLFTVEKERGAWELAGKPAFAANGRASPKATTLDKNMRNLAEAFGRDLPNEALETTGVLLQ